MRILLIFGAIIAGVFIMAVIFRPVPPKQQSAVISSSSVLSVVDSNSHDFGTISMAKGEVAHEFKIKNIGSEEVKISKIFTSCMCTTVQFIKGDIQKGPFGMAGHGYVPPVNELLAPDEEAVVKVVFDPTAHGPAGVGKIERTVHVEGISSMLAELNFTANVIP